MAYSSIESLEARIAPAFAPVIELAELTGNDGFKLNGPPTFAYSGRSVSAAGDVNGDGFGDIIIGAPREDSEKGVSYVVFGRAEGFPADFALSTIDGSNGFRLRGVAVGDRTGNSVSGAGDVNADGFDDLIVGAPNADPSGTYSGASYVVFGKPRGFPAIVELSDLDGRNGFKLNGAGERTFSGTVSSAGDINGDGFDDVIIGAQGSGASDSLPGAAYVVFGKADGFSPTLNLSNLDGIDGFKLNGVAAGDLTGVSVSRAGDINGDGIDDVIIGATLARGAAPGAGATYVIFGKTTNFPPEVALSNLNGSNGFTLTGATQDDRSGCSVSEAGDVNGDGFDDVIIGAFNASYSTITGESYIVFGKANGFPANLNFSRLDGNNGFKVTGGNWADNFGASVSAAGDVNADGFDDVIIGASRADPNAPYAGASYVIFGKPGPFAPQLESSALNGANGFRMNGSIGSGYAGFSVSTAGDLNGDGFDDVITGAHGAEVGQFSSGISYLVFGRGAVIDISDAALSEEDSGMTALQFAVNLSEPSAIPVSVNISTIDGTARSGEDYLATNQSVLTFSPGEISKTVTINVLGETLYESDETFSLVISDPRGGVIRDSVGVGTIRNNDAPPVVSLADASALEGNEGTSSVLFIARLSAASGLPATVNVASANGTAVTESDFEALGPGTLTFAPGETSKMIAVNAFGDTAVEDHETFSVILSDPGGATIEGGTATGTILNDDTALRISGPAATVEGDSGGKPFVFTIALEKESALSVTVSYATADGTALAGSDYEAVGPTQLTFAPGETSKAVAINVLGDIEIEARESFSVLLSGATNALIANGAASGTILNDDSSLNIGDISVLEGHAGSRPVTFRVSLSAESALPVSVNFASADGTATAGADYIQLASGTLEFAPGETSKTLTVAVLGDTLVEGEESFSVNLSDASNAVIDDGVGIGTILDDDVTLIGRRKATFTDVDEELVTIKVSKGTLKVEDFTIVPTGAGAQLALVDFSGEVEFAGANLSISAQAPRGVAGDGLAHVGFIKAGVDLGRVGVQGDLGQIDTGDGDGHKPAVKSLNVASLGARGVSTQEDPATASLESEIAGDLRKLKVKTDIATGVNIAVGGRLGSATIGGNLDGATLTALGVLNPAKAAAALAIGSLSIGGNVTVSQILAGYDAAGAARNADASIGKVLISGDWIASNLVASAAAGADGHFGTEDDALISGDNPTIARIASVLVKGSATGTAGGIDHFGFVAEEIAAFKADRVKLPLTSGPSNDLAGVLIGSTGDLKVREVV